jgi:hypothetical protein
MVYRDDFVRYEPLPLRCAFYFLVTMYILFVCLNKYWLYKIFTGAMKALRKPKKEDKVQKPSDDEGTELIDKNSKGE